MCSRLEPNSGPVVGCMGMPGVRVIASGGGDGAIRGAVFRADRVFQGTTREGAGQAVLPWVVVSGLLCVARDELCAIGRHSEHGY